MHPPETGNGPPPSRERLAAALALHSKGRFPEARALYELVLRDDPQNLDALQLLGVLSVQTGQYERAVALFSQGLGRAPKAAGLHANLGVAFKELGRLEEAIACYDKAIRLQPDFPATFYNKGVALAALRRLDEALASYTQAIALKPDYAEAFSDRGNVRLELQDEVGSLDDYDQAIALQPGYALAHFNRGVALRRMGGAVEALAALDKSIELRPDHAEAHINRAGILKDLRRFDEAVEGFQRVVALKPHDPAAHFQLGAILRHARRMDDAILAYNRAIALKPDFFEAHFGRGLALQSLGRQEDSIASFSAASELDPRQFEPLFMLGSALRRTKDFHRSIACFDKALALNPSHLLAHCERGLALHRLKRVDEAVACFDRAIAIEPNSSEAYLSRALCRLTIGDYPGGWRDYEWRLKARTRSFRRNFAQPSWAGAESLQGKTLFIHSEQGFGDLFQFGRYALLASLQAKRVVLEVRPSLVPFFRQWEPHVSIIADDVEPPDFDAHCPLMSLPGAFGTGIANIPNRVPYLSASEDRIAACKATLGQTGFKIGVCWQAGNEDIDPGRSFDLTHLSRLSQLPGVRLISLQKGAGEKQLEKCGEGLHIEKHAALDADAGIFMETAALIKACDLVVTCDTAVAHLAGALGSPTWVALKFVPEWRWLLDRPDSPWYPSLRLFRQPTDGDWTTVFEDMRSALIARVPDNKS